MTYGLKAKAGIDPAASWGEAWSASTILLPFVSENITKNFDRMMSKALVGQVGQHESQQGRQLVSGDLVIDLDYNNAELLEYAFGSEAGGVFTLADDLPMFHLEIDKGAERYRFQSCKVNQMTITGSAGSEDPIQVSMNITAYACTRTATAFTGGLSLATADRAYFEDIGTMEFDLISGTLTTADHKPISSFELVINHNLQTDGRDTSIPDNVLEPLRNDFRVVKLKCGLARNTTAAQAMATYAEDDSRIQGELNMTSGSGTAVWQFPQGKVVNPPQMNVGGPGVISSEVEIEWYPNTNNSNMAAVTDQVRVTIS